MPHNDSKQGTGKIDEAKGVVHDTARVGGDLVSHIVRTVGSVMETTVETAGGVGVAVVNEVGRVLVEIRNALAAVVTGEQSSTTEADRDPH